MRLPMFKIIWDLEFTQFTFSPEFKEHIELAVEETPVAMQLGK